MILKYREMQDSDREDSSLVQANTLLLARGIMLPLAVANPDCPQVVTNAEGMQDLSMGSDGCAIGTELDDCGPVLYVAPEFEQ